jgi:DNA-binding beta-propeller fold protein YncE
MKVLARIFTIFIVSSIFVAGCGATPTSTPTAVSPTQPALTYAPVATATAIPPIVQPKATESTPGILAVVPVAPGPINLAATSDSIWVESHRGFIVTRIDPAQNKEVARLKDAPVHCNVASGGSFVWAAEAHTGGGPNLKEGKITKIDPASGAVLGSIELATACGLAADNTDLWVTSPMLGQAVRYNADTLEERAVIPLGADVFEIAIGPEAVWASGESGGGTVWRIDPATNNVVTSINISDSTPSGLIAAFGSVWVGSRGKGLIYRIDPATNAVTETIQVNNSIGGIGVGPDAIWASGFGDGKIYRIDPSTNAVTSSLSTHFSNLGPPLFAFESIWVGALDQNVVLRIDPAIFDSSAATTP